MAAPHTQTMRSAVPEPHTRHEAPSRRQPCRLTVLGATGSIGTSTLDLVARNPDAFDVVAVTANSNPKALAEIALRHRAKIAVIGDDAHLAALRDALAGSGIRVASGPSALIEAASEPADCIMAAIVGAAGLKPTLAFQALTGAAASAIEKITLTASGGPFRTWSAEQLKAATPEQALKHPNWSMGAKVTIDSATLMNKGLELIEAFHLFPVGVEALDCLVHPQSIVHCLVSYSDGSVLAQLAPPDMRTPIAVALAWPGRMVAPTEKLDLAALGTLTFEAADETRFPALSIAKAAMKRGLTAPAVLNAANEVAVKAFLDRRIGFTGIPQVVSDTLEKAEKSGLVRIASTVEDILAVDTAARRLAEESVHRYL
jgi:1-deoxy-D-xylulose-5-phosphate reductoisomerase